MELNGLTIRDSDFPRITREMFESFKNVHTLILDDTKTEAIEEDTFQDLQKLTNLHITNNYITSFKSNILNSSNLVWLDISNNSLTSLSDLNISGIPSVTVLNISHNSLEYLPEDIMFKLNSSNRFFVIVDNNPWNCSHPLWKDKLSTEFVRVFCLNTSVDSSYAEAEEQNIIGNVNSTKEMSSSCSASIMNRHCPFWIFGALWTGVILGNIRKLKQLVFCPTNITSDDKTTQCGR